MGTPQQPGARLQQNDVVRGTSDPVVSDQRVLGICPQHFSRYVIVSLIVCPSTFSRTDVLFRPLQAIVGWSMYSEMPKFMFGGHIMTDI